MIRIIRMLSSSEKRVVGNSMMEMPELAYFPTYVPGSDLVRNLRE